MNNKKKDIKPITILTMIKAGYKASEIAKELGISRTGTSYHIKKMEREGLIVSKNMGIWHELTLTVKGSRGVHDCLTVKPEKPTKRLHAYGLKYQRLGTLKGALEPAQVFREVKEANLTITTLSHTTQATIKADITTKLTTKSLILYAPALYYHRGAPAITMEAEAKRILDNEAERWERRLGIKLRRVRKDVLWSIVIQEEIADEGHALAEEATKEGGQIVLAKHTDGKKRLVADKSMRTFADLETVHRASAGEDSDMLDRQFNALMNGEINLLDIQKIDRLETVLEGYATQIELHLKVMKEIDERLKQTRLF